ncbi:hypothetical protein [Massilia sp. S19_KUP03_FR1]|uniref:hypothetical protein n=1 Tax=Massilia sp. S19_KUP03_FR1 TaxID=3025503 RepID=UPI002FCD6996
MPSEAQLLLLDRDAVAAVMTTEMIGLAIHDAFALHSERQGRVFPVVRASRKAVSWSNRLQNTLRGRRKSGVAPLPMPLLPGYF